ncbi:unnamed protein product [Allacma fusca]|uniref:Uncharacterized protein n=1 Tax=Allacma fusca TaxID=39272 RepID=A0A8J2KHR9_9HEXA|nr:unnamed protein product [Allacma fusca]
MRAVTCFAFVFVACLAELIPMGSGTAYKYFRSIGPERRLSKLGVREQNIPVLDSGLSTPAIPEENIPGSPPVNVANLVANVANGIIGTNGAGGLARPVVRPVRHQKSHHVDVTE